jgi:hypothetical protein
MATGETGFDDVTFDLVSLQYHSLKAGHDYGQYVRDAENAGTQDIADFFERVMDQDSERAHKCHDFLAELGGTTTPSLNRDNTSFGWPNALVRPPVPPQARHAPLEPCPR